tara:strand:+ start:141 stop:527 length:387 start_codon:yes stop_codon:yes gene_type:complete
MVSISNGVDIVENKRIEKSIKNSNFIKRIFSEKEIKLSKNYFNKTNFYAKRFAAKEAFYKALGTGIRNGYKFKDVTVKNDKYGKPMIEINSKIKKMVFNQYRLKKFKLHLSLADEKKHSIAFVVLDKV